MRIATVAFCLFFFAALVGAWQLPPPAWFVGLYLAPALGVLALTGVLLIVFELMLGPHARAVSPMTAPPTISTAPIIWHNVIGSPNSKTARITADSGSR